MTGLNLADPVSAPSIIKPWDSRLDESTSVSSLTDDELILYIPFTHSLRVRSLLLHPPGPSHPHRAGRLRLFINLPRCPSFDELEGAQAVMDLDTSMPPPGWRRLEDGRREVEEWGLKVSKMANVYSVTLLFVRLPATQRRRER